MVYIWIIYGSGWINLLCMEQPMDKYTMYIDYTMGNYVLKYMIWFNYMDMY